MPSYHPLGITVRLSSVPLEETITSTVVLRKGSVAKQQSEAAEKKLLNSAYLPERRAPLQDDGDDHALTWLAGVPFLQVQAGTGFPSGSPSQSSDADRNRQQALALHVKLSRKSFDVDCTARSHLKIEVLFNGQLSACSNIHETGVRFRTQSLHYIFAGYRMDYLAERPWVLLPPDTTADGGTRSSRASITSSERWDKLSAAILTEAEDRGTDRNGDPPPSAQFLHALATEQPPPCIINLQKPGGKTFGVVDVIITAGYGKKPIMNGTTYLKRPQKLSDPSFTLQPQVEDATVKMDDQRESTTDVLQVSTSGGDELPLQDEPKKKRRTSSSARNVPQHASPSVDLRRQKSQKTIFSPPSHDIFSIPNKTNSKLPAPEQRSDDYKQPLSTINPKRIYDTIPTSPEMQHRGSSFLSQSFDSSSLTSSDPRPPYMPVYDGLLVRNPVFASMPGDVAPNTYGTHTSQPLAYPYAYAPHMPPTPSTYFTVPNRSMLHSPPSLTYHHWPQSSPARSRLNTYDQYSQPSAEHGVTNTSSPDTASYKDPDEFFRLLPRPNPFLSAASLAMLWSPPPGTPYPLPPAAMFSVTPKPRRSVSPTKSIRTVGSSGSNNELLINRLVITGRGGAPVLDHKWKTPQRMRVSQNLQARPNLDYFDPAQTDIKPLGSKQLSGENAQVYPKSVFQGTKLQFEIAERDQRRDSLQDRPTGDVPLPYLKRHQAPAGTKVLGNPWIDVPDEPAPLLPASVLTNAEPTLTAASENGTIADRIDVPDDLAPYLLAPLRTIEPTSLDELNAANDAAVTPVDFLSQLDGPREDTNLATPMRTPKKPSTVESGEPLDPDLSAPQPPASNKRKPFPSYKGYIKPTRSPDRLKTINNPPLNEDCVIAFAESANKKDQMGVLRQVKGERLGHFVEDSVVIAVRFFIAGDGKLEMAEDGEMEM